VYTAFDERLCAYVSTSVYITHLCLLLVNFSLYFSVLWWLLRIKMHTYWTSTRMVLHIWRNIGNLSIIPSTSLLTRCLNSYRVIPNCGSETDSITCLQCWRSSFLGVRGWFIAFVDDTAANRPTLCILLPVWPDELELQRRLTWKAFCSVAGTLAGGDRQASLLRATHGALKRRHDVDLPWCGLRFPR